MPPWLPRASPCGRVTALIRRPPTSACSSGGNSNNGDGTSLALGFVIATNVILSRRARRDRRSEGDDAGDVIVHAENLSQIDARRSTRSSAGEGAGVTLAFNSIGWKSQNFLFNAVDTLLGDPLIANAFGTPTRRRRPR